MGGWSGFPESCTTIFLTLNHLTDRGDLDDGFCCLCFLKRIARQFTTQKGPWLKAKLQ